MKKRSVKKPKSPKVVALTAVKGGKKSEFEVPDRLPYGTRVMIMGLPGHPLSELPGTVLNFQLSPFAMCEISYILQLDAVMENSLGKFGAVVMPASSVRRMR